MGRTYKTRLPSKRARARSRSPTRSGRTARRAAIPATTRFFFPPASAGPAPPSPRVVREKHALPARPEHGEKFLRRPLRALGQRGALHENGAASALFEQGKETSRLGGEESRGFCLQVRVGQRARGALEGRASVRDVRGERNGARRFSV